MQYELENYSERAGNKTAPLNLSTPPKVDLHFNQNDARDF